MRDDWITKSQVIELGMTEGQFKWRVLTGDIRRHPDSNRLYRRFDVERLVRCGRSAQKPFGTRPARLAMPKREGREKKRTSAEEREKTAKVSRLRACLALKICASISEQDTKLGRRVSGLFRISPEQIRETARQFQ